MSLNKTKENMVVFYGIPNDKRDCYKYAIKQYDGWELIWYNSFDGIEVKIPLGEDEIQKLII